MVITVSSIYPLRVLMLITARQQMARASEASKTSASTSMLTPRSLTGLSINLGFGSPVEAGVWPLHRWPHRGAIPDSDRALVRPVTPHGRVLDPALHV